ncbi:MAG TPA: MgtC/SapB family protein [Candidatus Sulfopaludibacter sp.]|jgi:putative Mg2+ transporter-C (MgtC) family protein|nr:MgtC/SapB family protein [Candidatus Sulfopaludibacter sp.]
MAHPLGMSDELYQVVRLLAAYALALPVGWYREREAHSVGIRTFPLAAMASCGYVLLATTMDPASQSRVIQGLVAGIGFIGGGAILKTDNNVHGTATAASIWTTGALGAAVAQEKYLLAVTLAAVNLFTLRVVLPWKQRKEAQNEIQENPTGPRL